MYSSFPIQWKWDAVAPCSLWSGRRLQTETLSHTMALRGWTSIIIATKPTFWAFTHTHTHTCAYTHSVARFIGNSDSEDKLQRQQGGEYAVYPQAAAHTHTHTHTHTHILYSGVFTITMQNSVHTYTHTHTHTHTHSRTESLLYHQAVQYMYLRSPLHTHIKSHYQSTQTTARVTVFLI